VQGVLNAAGVTGAADARPVPYGYGPLPAAFSAVALVTNCRWCPG
jgi:hypothetical protein